MLKVSHRTIKPGRFLITRHQAFIGLGSNRGDKKKNCLNALSRLQAIPDQEIIRVSSWYFTEPVGLDDPEWFINGVALLDTSLLPEILMRKMLNIETAMGRKRTVKWGPRVIDLDLLFYDQIILNSPDLTIPHPFLEKRRFVLEPMAEVAPDYVHPVLQMTVARLRDELAGEGQALIKLQD